MQAFIVAELGANADRFMLHIYAALAEKEQALIADRTHAAPAQKKAQGAKLGNLDQSGRGAGQGGRGEPHGRGCIRSERAADRSPDRSGRRYDAPGDCCSAARTRHPHGAG
jgi:hypothetical protein